MSQYYKTNKVCATCAHWGGNRNSIAGGFQVSPTSSSGRCGSTRSPHRGSQCPQSSGCPGWEKWPGLK